MYIPDLIAGVQNGVTRIEEDGTVVVGITNPLPHPITIQRGWRIAAMTPIPPTNVRSVATHTDSTQETSGMATVSAEVWGSGLRAEFDGGESAEEKVGWSSSQLASPPHPTNSEVSNEEDVLERDIEGIVAGVCKAFTESDKQLLREVLREHKGLWSRKLGRTTVERYHIPLKPGARPTTSGLYRRSPKEEEAIQSEIEPLLANGTIRPGNGPWGSPVVLVKKTDGTWRFLLIIGRSIRVP